MNKVIHIIEEHAARTAGKSGITLVQVCQESGLNVKEVKEILSRGISSGEILEREGINQQLYCKPKSNFRGYEIHEINGKLVFCDTGKSTVETWKARPCGHCGKNNTPEGHDGCLETLPGVINACCGHGETAASYLQFPDGSIIRGREAITEINKLKK